MTKLILTRGPPPIACGLPSARIFRGLFFFPVKGLGAQRTPCDTSSVTLALTVTFPKSL